MSAGSAGGSLSFRSISMCCCLTPSPSPQGPPEMLQQVWLGGLGVCPLPGVLHVLVLTSGPTSSPPPSCSGRASPSTVKAGRKETGPFTACLVGEFWQLTLNVTLSTTFTQYLPESSHSPWEPKSVLFISQIMTTIAS